MLKKKLGNRMADRYWGAEKMFICGVISVGKNWGGGKRGKLKKLTSRLMRNSFE